MTKQKRIGTRCAVCVGCGKCFSDAEDAASGGTWTGERCDVCVGCGKCAQAWGLVKSNGEGVTDATTGATGWASAFKVFDVGQNKTAPPAIGAAPGVSVSRETTLDVSRETQGAKTQEMPGEQLDFDHFSMKQNASGDVDAQTGATPGVANACKELGLNDMAAVMQKYNVKPPGQH